MSKFNEIIKDKKLMRGIYALTLISALLVLVLVIKGPDKGGTRVAGVEGRVIATQRAKTSGIEH